MKMVIYIYVYTCIHIWKSMKLYEHIYISIHGSKLLWYFCLAKSPFSRKHNGVFHPFSQDCVRQGMKGGKKQHKPGSNSTGRYAIEDTLFAFLLGDSNGGKLSVLRGCSRVNLMSRWCRITGKVRSGNKMIETIFWHDQNIWVYM